MKVEATMMDGNFTYRADEQTSWIDEGSESVLLTSAALIQHLMCGQ